MITTTITLIATTIIITTIISTITTITTTTIIATMTTIIKGDVLPIYCFPAPFLYI